MSEGWATWIGALAAVAAGAVAVISARVAWVVPFQVLEQQRRDALKADARRYGAYARILIGAKDMVQELTNVGLVAGTSTRMAAAFRVVEEIDLTQAPSELVVEAIITTRQQCAVVSNRVRLLLADSDPLKHGDLGFVLDRVKDILEEQVGKIRFEAARVYDGGEPRHAAGAESGDGPWWSRPPR